MEVKKKGAWLSKQGVKVQSKSFAYIEHPLSRKSTSISDSIASRINRRGCAPWFENYDRYGSGVYIYQPFDRYKAVY